MKTTKTIYLVPVLAFLLVMLQRAWFNDEARGVKTAPAATEVKKIGGLGKIKNFRKDHDILIHTDKMTVNISLQGGAITGASLSKFSQSIDSQSPFTLLSDNPEHLYIAQSGMSGDADLKYVATQKEFFMGDNDETLVVPLTARDEFGRTYTKKFRFFRKQYHFNVESAVENKSNSNWTGIHYSRLILRHDSEQPTPAKSIPVDIDAPKAGWFTFSTYTGPAYYSDTKPYVKLPFSEVEKKPVKRSIDSSGWIAMQQRYFICAFIPQQSSAQTVTATWQSGASEVDGETSRNLFNFYTVGPSVVLAPGEKVAKTSTFYAGPEDAKRLAALAKGLELTVDYGWLWFISDLLFRGLVFIHRYLGSWGWSIVMITCVVKLAFFKLSEASYKAMAKQKKLQPKIDAINETYKDDAEKKSKALVSLYQKESINPISGCLPTLLQMPFFIALYYVLIESVQLRFAPFLWVPDLSTKDPLFILPALFCLSMVAMQKISPAPQGDKSQANAMLFMPFAMSIMFAQMPAGLLLYWVTNNGLSLLQQWFVMQHYNK